MSSPFDYAQAQWHHPTRNWRGYCLIFVRTAFGVGAKYPSAASAWKNAKYKHYTNDPHAIPRGVPVFWLGGSRGYGHIALSRGGGSCWSTDFVHSGRVDTCNIADITSGWNQQLVGWTEDLNGVRVYTPPSEKPAAKEAPKKSVKPTRISKARSKLAEALELLNAAVRNGRHVRKQTAAITAADHDLPKN